MPQIRVLHPSSLLHIFQYVPFLRLYRTLSCQCVSVCVYLSVYTSLLAYSLRSLLLSLLCVYLPSCLLPALPVALSLFRFLVLSPSFSFFLFLLFYLPVGTETPQAPCKFKVLSLFSKLSPSTSALHITIMRSETTREALEHIIAELDQVSEITIFRQ